MSVPINKSQMTKQVNKLRELKAMREALDDQIADLQSKIIDELDNAGYKSGDKFVNNDYSISWSECTRKTIVASKVREAYGDDISRFQTECSYRRLNVK